MRDRDRVRDRVKVRVRVRVRVRARNYNNRAQWSVLTQNDNTKRNSSIHQQVKRIDLIHVDRYEEMKNDLEKRTGLQINRFEIGKIDFLNDTAQVRIYYYADDQALSDYHTS